MWKCSENGFCASLELFCSLEWQTVWIWVKMARIPAVILTQVHRRNSGKENDQIYWHHICHLILTHSGRRPQNIYSQEEINLYCIIELVTEIFYVHYKSVKLDVLCRQNKIWTFGNPFQSKKLPICTWNSYLQSLYMLPSWGFADYFA